jgi:hypothetical protein
MAGRIPAEEEVAVYKSYLDDLGRLGGRHETLRAFYLSIVSALVTILGLTGSTGPFADAQKETQLAVAAVGFLLALLWSAHMRSFSVYFDAKRTVLGELEEGWSLTPFSKEVAKTSAKRFYRVTYVDQFVAVAFMLLFGSIVVTRFPL